MIVKYRTGGYGKNLIEKIEVDRETEINVWIDGRRHAKDSLWHKYWDSWEDAHTFLLEKATRSLEGARRSLERAQSEHGNIKGMKAP